MTEIGFGGSRIFTCVVCGSRNQKSFFVGSKGGRLGSMEAENNKSLLSSAIEEWESNPKICKGCSQND